MNTISEISKVFRRRLSENKFPLNTKVRIPSNLTSDPINKQGETGLVKSSDLDNEIITVQFDDGKLGMYQFDVFKGMNEVSEEDIEQTKELTTAVNDLKQAKDDAGIE
jgi:hypothetical protein